ncbi:hypothetical protein EYM_02190 [Ignicoccus islandicus DSM 13165]|uniref:Uncharacterized protein n=1 Tax=Ignicoccus islandicus DSM 13165 TaxID=940295 RepID=A0A0U3F9H6_9CREN|nr:hypothetical protein [Ignicoccus islandicus]ALU12297.1 hypothetical protein EYM_02190 [Ignicoccus islandicus DSM 13165]
MKNLNSLIVILIIASIGFSLNLDLKWMQKVDGTIVSAAVSDSGTLAVLTDRDLVYLFDRYGNFIAKVNVYGDISDIVYNKGLFIVMEPEGDKLWLIYENGSLWKTLTIQDASVYRAETTDYGILLYGSDIKLVDLNGSTKWTITLRYPHEATAGAVRGKYFYYSLLPVGKIYVLDLENGRNVAESSFNLGGRFTAVAMTTCGNYLAVLTLTNLYLMDISKVVPSVVWESSEAGGEPFEKIAFSPDCRYIAVGDVDTGRLKVFDITGKLVFTKVVPNTFFVFWQNNNLFAVTPGEIYAFTVDESALSPPTPSLMGLKVKIEKIIEFSIKESISSLDFEFFLIRNLEVTPDGYIGASFHNIFIIETIEGDLVNLINTDGNIYSIDYYNGFFALGTGNSVYLVNKNGTLINEINTQGILSAKYPLIIEDGIALCNLNSSQKLVKCVKLDYSGTLKWETELNVSTVDGSLTEVFIARSNSNDQFYLFLEVSKDDDSGNAHYYLYLYTVNPRDGKITFKTIIFKNNPKSHHIKRIESCGSYLLTRSYLTRSMIDISDPSHAKVLWEKTFSTPVIDNSHLIDIDKSPWIHMEAFSQDCNYLALLSSSKLLVVNRDGEVLGRVNPVDFGHVAWSGDKIVVASLFGYAKIYKVTPIAASQSELIITSSSSGAEKGIPSVALIGGLASIASRKLLKRRAYNK